MAQVHAVRHYSRSLHASVAGTPFSWMSFVLKRELGDMFGHYLGIGNNSGRLCSLFGHQTPAILPIPPVGAVLLVVDELCQASDT